MKMKIKIKRLGNLFKKTIYFKNKKTFNLISKSKTITGQEKKWLKKFSNLAYCLFFQF